MRLTHEARLVLVGALIGAIVILGALSVAIIASAMP